MSSGVFWEVSGGVSWGVSGVLEVFGGVLNEKKCILHAHGLSAEGAKADVKKHTRLTILPFCVIKS